jgi:hypothetical protein
VAWPGARKNASTTVTTNKKTAAKTIETTNAPTVKDGRTPWGGLKKS